MSNVKKNFIYNTFYQVLSILTPLITTPYLSRILGSDKIGVFSYNFSIVHYFSLFIMLGLNNYGNRTIASCRDDKQLLSHNFISIYSFQLFCGLIVSICYFCYVFVFASQRIIALLFYFYLFGEIVDINWFFFGMEEFKLTVIRNSIIKIASTVMIFLCVKNIDDIDNYCFIFSISFFISQICLWPYITKRIKFQKVTLSDIAVHIKPNCILFVTVVLVSLFKIMDKIMLGLLSSYEEVGFYESSEKIVSLPTALINALGVVMLPRATNLISNNKEDVARRYIGVSISFALLIASSMCFGIMGLSKEFVPMFYGKGFDKCILVFIAILPSSLFLAFANVIRTQYLLPKKMDKSYVISASAGAIVNIIINLIMIPKMGSVGAAIGTFFAEFAVCFCQVYAVRKYLPIQEYIRKTFPFIASGIVMFVILFNIHISFSALIVQLALKFCIGLVIYIICLLVLSYIYKCVYKEQLLNIGIIKNRKIN